MKLRLMALWVQLLVCRDSRCVPPILVNFALEVDNYNINNDNQGLCSAAFGQVMV